MTARDVPVVAIFTMFSTPTIPRVRAILPGDDLDALIREELGGEPDSRADADPTGQKLGVTDIYQRGGNVVHVHTHPDALAALEFVILRLKLDLIAEELDGLTPCHCSTCACC